MNSKKTAKRIARILSNISQPARIRILLTIGKSEACVCHLEAVLGYRQAYISQHLMSLRKVGLLDSRREGRFVFYQLNNPKLLELIEMAATLTGLSEDELRTTAPPLQTTDCGCPTCSPVYDPQ